MVAAYTEIMMIYRGSSERTKGGMIHIKLGE